MPSLRAPRFVGDDVLESCLTGHRILAGSGDPPDSVSRIQQALSDLGFTVAVDGIFGPQTGAAVTSYKTNKGLVPNDPVVGPGTMGALDDDFAHELFDAQAALEAGTAFDPGARTGTRLDLEDGLATCTFANGLGVEVGHARAYILPPPVADLWTQSGGADGPFGAPAGDPFVIDATRSAQEFEQVGVVFGTAPAFAIARPLWEASVSGRPMIGAPIGPAQPLVTGDAQIVPHDTGVVLTAGPLPPQPLPQKVFDFWQSRDTSGAALGGPIAYAFPVADATVFPFQFGQVSLDAAGNVS